MEATFKDPEPPSYTEAQSYPSVQPIELDLKPESKWTAPPLVATAPPMPTAPPMHTVPPVPPITPVPSVAPVPPITPVPPAPPMAPGQLPVDINMLLTPQQLDVLLHVSRQQLSTIQSQQQQQEEVIGTYVLIVLIIISVINALFNIAGLIPFGIPVIVCSCMAYRDNKKEKYASAKHLACIAFFLSALNMVFNGLCIFSAITASLILT